MNPPGRHVLADPERAGICPVSTDQRSVLSTVAATLGFAVVPVDLRKVADKPGLLEVLARALDFPPDFGHNWDALSDSLSDLSWLPAPGYMLIFDEADALYRASAEVFKTLLDILSEVIHKQAGAGVPLWVLLVSEADASFA